jgi:Rieske Fe-S protein
VSTETKQPEAGDGPRPPLKLPQLSDQAPAPRIPSTVDPQTLRRRKFLNWLCIGMGGASVGSIVWAVIGFMLAPLESESKGVWRAVGKVDDFEVGSTTIVKLEDASTVTWAGYAGKTAAWLRRDGKATFTCFSINCTHLGCPVRWIDMPWRRVLPGRFRCGRPAAATIAAVRGAHPLRHRRSAGQPGADHPRRVMIGPSASQSRFWNVCRSAAHEVTRQRSISIGRR